MTITRREALAATATATVVAATLARPAHAAEPTVPGLEFVFAAEVTLGPPVELGNRDGARQRFVPITGGTVTGPRLTGIVMPGGGDRQAIRPDGLTTIRAQYFLKAADGTVIGIDNPGVRVAAPDIIARLTAGEDLDPSLYYFRTTPVFDVVDGPHGWLRRSVFVCQGIRHPKTVALRVFRVG